MAACVQPARRQGQRAAAGRLGGCLLDAAYTDIAEEAGRKSGSAPQFVG